MESNDTATDTRVIPSRADGEGPHNRGSRHASFWVISQQM